MPADPAHPQALTNRNADGLTPAEVMEAAKPGDVVRFTMRGPADDEGLKATMRALEAQYPGVIFELDHGAVQSHAEVVGHVDPA